MLCDSLVKQRSAARHVNNFVINERRIIPPINCSAFLTFLVKSEIDNILTFAYVNKSSAFQFGVFAGGVIFCGL